MKTFTYDASECSLTSATMVFSSMETNILQSRVSKQSPSTRFITKPSSGGTEIRHNTEFHIISTLMTGHAVDSIFKEYNDRISQEKSNVCTLACKSKFVSNTILQLQWGQNQLKKKKIPNSKHKHKMTISAPMDTFKQQKWADNPNF